MFLARCELDVTVLSATGSVLVCAVHQNIVAWWRTTTLLKILVGNGVNVFAALVEPIADSVCAKVDVVVG